MVTFAEGLSGCIHPQNQTGTLEKRHYPRSICGTGNQNCPSGHVLLSRYRLRGPGDESSEEAAPVHGNSGSATSRYYLSFFQ